MSVQELAKQSVHESKVLPVNRIEKQLLKENNIPINDIKKHVETILGYVPTISEKIIIDTIEKVNKKLEGANREFEFSIHEKTKEIIVKVVDKDTKEIIREIPSEKMVDMVVAMCENAGLFVDEKR